MNRIALSKFYLVFGSTNPTGRSVIRNLVDRDHCVFAVTDKTKPVSPETNHQVRWVPIKNLTDPKELKEALDEATDSINLDGVIYDIGHAKNSQSLDSLKDLSLKNYRGEIEVHLISLLNIYHCVIDKVDGDGCFVFISSAVPKNGNLGLAVSNEYHHGVVEGGHWLIRGIRHDPEITRRRIKVHRLIVKPTTTANQAADEVLVALESDKIIDREI